MTGKQEFRAVAKCGQRLVTKDTLVDALNASTKYRGPNGHRGYVLSHIERWDCVEIIPASRGGR